MISVHNKARWVFVVSALSFALGACNYDVSKTGSPSAPGATGAPGSGGAPVPQSQLSFDFVLQNAIRPACFGCHASPRNASGLNLETYEEVFANLAKIEQAVSARWMPESQGRTMTDAQRSLLLEWIAAGAPRHAEGAGL